MSLDLKDVSLKRNGKWLLHSVNWQVKEKENWVLYGLNGAGKTALLNMLCSYYFPTSGEMTVLGHVFGKEALGEKLRKKIGLISAGLEKKLHPDDRAFEIVLSGAFASIGLYESPTDDMREKAIDLLKAFGSIKYANRTYETLSQGEKQKVLIARALMNDPELLILDEPVTGLDFLAREQVLDMISMIASKPDAPTLLYTTHHAEDISPVFQHTLLLKEGTVFCKGETKQMMTSDTLTSFFNCPVEVMWRNERPHLIKL
ncbi:ABC transporter ATP-binding protein [Bacillus pumilus]|nr:ABC transporter ATP-binding protein [Bacillus pumilus]OLP66528.1 putative ABC transporter ATP-binding protein YlmA [Bacillus pumilus]